ncbi:MAG TPA: choice-of-anchor M domain-containing protein [Cellulomonas sp.]
MAGAALLALVVLLVPGTARADDDGSDLDQALEADEPIAHGARVLSSGHADIGPRYDEDGSWRLMLHDDTARADGDATSTWRSLDETVFQVVDEAVLTVPDDDAYDFLGAEPGSEVYVVPQTQSTDVVWMGWNTQDPTVMETIDRGVTLTLDGVQGPGQVTVYLQSGSFEEPQTLWTSTSDESQPLWVDVNTHTHANWVFTEPGVYLVQMTVSADLVDGSTVSDTEVLHLAVGTATSTDEALAATWAGEAASSDEATATAGSSAGAAAGDGATDAAADGARSTGTDLLVPVLVGAIVLVAVALVAGFTIAVLRGKRTRRRILAARRTAEPGTGPDGDDRPAGGERA